MTFLGRQANTSLQFDIHEQVQVEREANTYLHISVAEHMAT